MYLRDPMATTLPHANGGGMNAETGIASKSWRRMPSGLSYIGAGWRLTLRRARPGTAGACKGLMAPFVRSLMRTTGARQTPGVPT